jgi:hypothetical protein
MRHRFLFLIGGKPVSNPLIHARNSGHRAQGNLPADHPFKMILEFVGGSRDGSILEVSEASAPAFLMPLYMEPLAPLIRPISDEEAMTFNPPACEVYEQTEPGKLLFRGWNE